jgi:hypothetical protein
MAGLDPAIHVLRTIKEKKGVDARDKRGHDEECKRPGISPGPSLFLAGADDPGSAAHRYALRPGQA